MPRCWRVFLSRVRKRARSVPSLNRPLKIYRDEPGPPQSHRANYAASFRTARAGQAKKEGPPREATGTVEAARGE